MQIANPIYREVIPRELTATRQGSFTRPRASYFSLDGSIDRIQKPMVVLELKIDRSSKTLEEGLEQTAEYMRTKNATEGHLIIFDRSDKSWDQKIYQKTLSVGMEDSEECGQCEKNKFGKGSVCTPLTIQVWGL